MAYTKKILDEIKIHKKPSKYKYYNFNLKKRIRKFALFNVNLTLLSVKQNLTDLQKYKFYIKSV